MLTRGEEDCWSLICGGAVMETIAVRKDPSQRYALTGTSIFRKKLAESRKTKRERREAGCSHHGADVVMNIFGCFL